MIMAAVANTLGNGMLQKAFCDEQVTESLRPLIGLEKFASGVEPDAGSPIPVSSAPPQSGPAGALGDFVRPLIADLQAVRGRSTPIEQLLGHFQFQGEVRLAGVR